MSKIIDQLCTVLCSSRLNTKDEQIAELEAEIEDLRRPDWPELNTTEVSHDDVESALQSLSGWGLKQSYWWDDYTYRVPSVADFNRVAERDSTDHKQYVDDYFDCDNYADSIMAMFARRYTCNAVGVVISPEAEPPHAFNVVVVQDGDDIEARLWEPQSDEWVTDSDDPKYTLRGAMIRI